MDLLSEVLRVVRLTGAIHLRGEFTEPWAFLSTPPELLAARYNLPEGEVSQFHVFVEGNCWVSAGKLAPVRMETGDVVIFPRAEQYIMASDVSVTPVPIKDIFAQPSREQITDLKYGGPGRSARFICGYLHFDHQFDPLLDSLPALLCVRSRAGEVILETWDKAGRWQHPLEHQQEAEWWQASLRYLISETSAVGPGNHAVLARLAESLFVQVLHWQLRYATQGRVGWLAGAPRSADRPRVAAIACAAGATVDRGRACQGGGNVARGAGQTLCRTSGPIAYSISRQLAHASRSPNVARKQSGHR